MLHLRGFRGSRRNKYGYHRDDFASICSARSLHTHTHLSGAQFSAIFGIAEKTLCSKCKNLFRKRYNSDPNHPELSNVDAQYNLYVLEHTEL